MTIEEAIARAIAFVQLNGGDPGQPAMRWNGHEMEPQSFPAWKDYRDEATQVRFAIEAAGYEIVKRGPDPLGEALNTGDGSYRP